MSRNKELVMPPVKGAQPGGELTDCIVTEHGREKK